MQHGCSTWDELYEDDDGEKPNEKHAWNGPAAAQRALARVANALKPGVEIVLRMNAKGRKRGRE